MNKQKLSKEDNARMFVSVDDLILYLVENYDPKEVQKKAISCGFDEDVVRACKYFADLVYSKEHYEEALIKYRNYYYLYNELKPKHTHEFNNQFLNFNSFNHGYKFVVIESIKLLENFSGGKILIRDPKIPPSVKDISFLEYIKSDECYQEEITLYFENYPHLLFSFSFGDEKESQFNAFNCYIHVHSTHKDIETHESIQLDCARRRYYNVPQYFNNRFMRFMAYIILVNFFHKSDDINSRTSIAFYLCEYLKSKGVLLPESKYPFHSGGQYPIDTMVVDNKGSTKSVNSIIPKINKMEKQRGVKENHMTLLNFYLQGVVEKEIKNIYSHNLQNLENEYKLVCLKK